MMLREGIASASNRLQPMGVSAADGLLQMLSGVHAELEEVTGIVDKEVERTLAEALNREGERVEAEALEALQAATALAPPAVKEEHIGELQGVINRLFGAVRAGYAVPHHPLLTTHYHTTHYPLPTTHYSLPTTYYSLLTTHYSLYSAWSTVRRPPRSMLRLRLLG